MWPLSAAAAAALRGSHTIRVRVDVLDNGEIIDTLPVTAGAVTVDKTAAIRRRLTCSLADPDGLWTPGVARDLLVPGQTQLRPYRGVQLPSGDFEMVPLGVFTVAKPRIVDSGGDVTITLDGYDRARKVSRNRWRAPFVIADGTTVEDAVEAIVSDRMPGTTFNLALTAETVPQVVLGLERDNDPWKDAQQIAASAGCELFFDQAGVCTMRPEPDPLTDPVVWEYHEGEASLLSVDRSLDDDRAYNGVVVTGEAPGYTPVVAEAWDLDPTSPTYAGAPIGSSDYGAVPFFLTSSLLTTQAQAQAVADAQLRAVLGSIEAVTFDGIVNPAHDGGDVISIRRARAGISSTFVLDRLVVPLGWNDAMTGTTRQRRAAA